MIGISKLICGRSLTKMYFALYLLILTIVSVAFFMSLLPRVIAAAMTAGIGEEAGLIDSNNTDSEGMNSTSGPLNNGSNNANVSGTAP